MKRQFILLLGLATALNIGLASSAGAGTGDYPAKGKAITLIVAQPPGGSTDIGARILADELKKVLEVPIQIVNKPGGGGQIGYTELSRSKPDGYTIGVVAWPSLVTSYLDPKREAVYTRKNFQPVAMHLYDPGAVAVKADSKYKSIQDLIDAAKAAPNTITAGAAGILNPGHLGILLTERAAKVQFRTVQLAGDAPAMTALLGRHIESFFAIPSGFLAHLKSGEARVLAVMGDKENPFLPGVKTMRQQGYDFTNELYRGILAPAGTPKEIVNILTTAIKKAMESEEHKSRTQASLATERYMTPEELESFWVRQETLLADMIKPFLK